MNTKRYGNSPDNSRFWRAVGMVYNHKINGQTDDEIRAELAEKKYTEIDEIIEEANARYPEWLKRQHKTTNNNGNGHSQYELVNLPRGVSSGHYVKNPPGVITYIPEEMLSKNGNSAEVEALRAKITRLEAENAKLRSESDQIRNAIAILLPKA